MSDRWTSTYVVEWTPILTFTRRRLQLLEWLDEHVEPVSFVERPDSVGVAILSEDLRVSARRDRLVVDTGLSGAGIQAVLPTLQGVFETLQPNGAVLAMCQTRLSARLDADEYDDERAQFARSVSGLSARPDSGYRPVDASALLDLQCEGLAAQVEYGVVNRSELVDRLLHPQRGRIPSRAVPAREPDAADSLRGRDLPDVALFVDVLHTRIYGGSVESPEELLTAGAALDEAATGLADGLHENFAKETRT